MKHVIACALLPVLAATAQVNLKFTPEPMAVPMAALSNAKDMGRWIVEGCNDGSQPVAVAWERISMAAGQKIRFIDPADALLVLTSNQQKTVAGVVAKAGGLASELAALGLAIASKANWPLAAGLSLGSLIAPGVVKIAQGEIPPVNSLVAGQTYPLTLAPGACFTDHRFAARMKAAAAITAVIEGAPSAPAAVVPAPSAPATAAPAAPAPSAPAPATPAPATKSARISEPILAFDVMAGPADIRRMAFR